MSTTNKDCLILAADYMALAREDLLKVRGALLQHHLMDAIRKAVEIENDIRATMAAMKGE